MYQVGVIGDRDSVMGYRALGMAVFEAVDPQDAAAAVDELVKAHYAVIFLTEALAEAIAPHLQQYRDRRLPSIIPIPSIQGSTGFGMRQISESVRRAVGIDLFGHDDQQADSRQTDHPQDDVEES
ncbi:MAG: V-type ATP synthase subunit F [Clostridiaceae bacterium]|jgi:V/A-type H+-transporting ATPase subunit F|nr:V-type ATP synthase subunit F [Clostridiaceae bacterium]